MFDLRGDDVFVVRDEPAEFAGLDRTRRILNGPGDERIHSTKDGVVVGLGAAAGEDDFLGACADEGGDLFSGGFDGGAGALAGGVDGGSVCEIDGEIREHGVEDLGVDGRRSVVIEVDAVHGAALRILRWQ